MAKDSIVFRVNCNNLLIWGMEGLRDYIIKSYKILSKPLVVFEMSLTFWDFSYYILKGMIFNILIFYVWGFFFIYFLNFKTGIFYQIFKHLDNSCNFIILDKVIVIYPNIA